MTETKCFVESDQDSVALPSRVFPDSLSGPTPEDSQEVLRVLAIGSLDAVNSCVRTLYKLKYAYPGEWSQALPTGNPGEVMRILTRRYG
jgi:hypothetical protein